jgi:hypothetical protein
MTCALALKELSITTTIVVVESWKRAHTQGKVRGPVGLRADSGNLEGFNHYNVIVSYNFYY